MTDLFATAPGSAIRAVSRIGPIGSVLTFISCHHSDTQQVAQAVYAQLRTRFGPSCFFMNVVVVHPGTPWPDHISRSLDKLFADRVEEWVYIEYAKWLSEL